MNTSKRIWIIAIGVLVLFAVLEVNLFIIQVVDSEELKYFARKQQITSEVIPAERGSIYDRNKNLLVYNNNGVSVFAEMATVTKWETQNAIADTLSHFFKRPASYYLKLMKGSKKTVRLESKVSSPQSIILKKLRMSGLKVVNDPTRVYQYKNLASHIIGYVDRDNIGTSGIESKFDEELRGENGKRVYVRDAVGNMITVVDGLTTEAVTGNDITLTIDIRLQQFLEEELRQGLQDSKGDYAVGIIMDPNTGEILALSNMKDFDPNRFNEYSDETRRNKAVSDVYEPGSTFKTFSMAAYLNEKICNPSDVLNTRNGSLEIHGMKVSDSHGFDNLSVKDIFAQSSNVGMSLLSEKIKSQKLFTYLRGFGFGNYTNIEMPAEVRGVLTTPNLWSKQTKITLSYGYSVSVTPLQLAAAFCSVVNGGLLYEPHVVKEIRPKDGKEPSFILPNVIRRIISEETSAIMRDFLGAVVTKGTGKSAFIKGIEVGGKTGTSRRLQKDGAYSEEFYNSSFVGCFPLKNPKYVCYIMVNSPREGGYYGGSIAAPIFKRVAERIVTLQPELKNGNGEQDTVLIDTKTASLETDGNKPDTMRQEGPVYKKSEVVLPEIKDNIMPDITGLPVRSALTVLARLSIPYTIQGTGVVVSQSVPPGKKLNKQKKITVKAEEQKLLGAVLY